VSAANHRLRAWRADDAQVLMDAAAGDIDIARQLPPLETISDAHAHIAKTAGNDDRVAFAIVNGDDVVVGESPRR